MVHPASALGGVTGEAIIRKCATVMGVHNYDGGDLAGAVALLGELHSRGAPWGQLFSPPMPLGDLPAALEEAKKGRWARVVLEPSPVHPDTLVRMHAVCSASVAVLTHNHHERDGSLELVERWAKACVRAHTIAVAAPCGYPLDLLPQLRAAAGAAAPSPRAIGLRLGLLLLAAASPSGAHDAGVTFHDSRKPLR
jgi:hypothetical protein